MTIINKIDWSELGNPPMWKILWKQIQSKSTDLKGKDA